MAVEVREETQVQSQVHDWFEKTIHDLRVKQLQYNTGTMSDGDAKRLENIATNTFDPEGAYAASQYTHKEFVRELLTKYFDAVNGVDWKRLAFELKSSKIIVWVTIADDAEDLEKLLYRIEATVNSQFSRYGFSVDTMIVEEQDNINVPSHFIEVR